MKPVEIEFIMRDKLSPGIDKAGKSAETLGDKAEQVSKSITDRIAAQKEQIKYVESCLKDLKKQYDNLAPGKAQLEMRAEIDACTKALQEDKNILSSLEAEHDKASVSTKRLSMQLREMQDAMARLRLEGKQNTKEYAEMADKAAVLADTIGDLRTQTNILANDDAALQGVMSGVNGLSGLFTTATGVMGIFASENEDLIKIQTRVQSVMAVTMGLQQVMNTLNKDSAFRLVTVVKMKKLLTAANTKLAVSLGISNAAATALMATLTLGLSAVITGLIVLWDKYTVALSVESAGSTLGSFTVTSGAGESVEIPDLTALGDVYDVTNEDDMSAYAATLDLTTLMDNLSNAGVPDEVITYVLSGGSNSDAEDVTDENASEAESDAESAEAGAA